MMDRGAQHGADGRSVARGAICRPRRCCSARRRAASSSRRRSPGRRARRSPKQHGVPARVIGTVGALDAPLTITTAAVALVAPLAALDEAYHEAIPRIMSQPRGVAVAIVRESF